MAADVELLLFVYIMGKPFPGIPSTSFSVPIERSKTVDELKKAIFKEAPYLSRVVDAAHQLTLYKTELEDGENLEQLAAAAPKKKLKVSSCELSEVFPERLGKKIVSILVEIQDFVPPEPPSKRPRLDDSGTAKSEMYGEAVKSWTVNGAIGHNEVNNRYYVDPGAQNETLRCLSAASDNTYLLLAGPRASGKTTRLIWLQQRLQAMGYWALYMTLEEVLHLGSTEDFWKSFGKVIDRAAVKCGRGSLLGLTTPISSRADLQSYLSKDFWNRNVVLLLDEFSNLYQAQDNVRNDCLVAFRGLKQSGGHAVKCLIAAGTFSIIYLNPSTSGVSPFNVADTVQCPSFTIDETRKLFLEFAKDLRLSIDDAVVEDVWTKSNGHPGMVCLCGRTIYKNIQTLVCFQSDTISYDRWKRFPAEQLYREISIYSTFYSMIQSLSRAEASSSVDLLRSQFAGFLGNVTLNSEKAQVDADALTAEGVLVKPDPAEPCYRMASPLVDGLIRNRLIPAKFPHSPSSPIPLQPTGDVDVLGILIESLKFFDKALILNASYYSYKTPKVKISVSHGHYVPRESVYDTELTRILANWPRDRHYWVVHGQWHLEDNSKHKYSDIVLKKGGRTIVLELLATGEPRSVMSHIQKTPGYAALLSADEAWAVHFTRQEDYHPIWQSDMDNVNMVHFAHDPEFTSVVMSTRWKDRAGEIQEEVRRLSLDTSAINS